MRSQDLPSQPIPSGPERERRTLDTVLGVALPLIAGVSVWALPWIWGAPDMFDSAWPFLIIVVMTAVFAFTSGYLLQSWWAALIAPAAWLAGELLSSAIAIPIIAGSVPAADQSSMSLWQIYLTTAAVLAVYSGIPNAALAALGVVFHRWRKRRRPAARVTAGAF